MKSFQNFAYTITEAEERVKTNPAKLNVSQPILPMQPEGETAPSKPASPKKKTSKPAGTSKPKGSRVEAIKKGYVSPEGRVQERGVITNRIRAGALGYGDAGKDPSKYGINPVEVSKEKGTLFARATSPLKKEKRVARSEIKKAVKSIEKRYPEATQRGTSFRGFSRSVDTPKPSPQDISTLQRMARPETSLKSAQSLSVKLGGTGAGKRAQAASDAAKDIKSYEKQRGFHSRVLQAIKELPPEKPEVKIPKPTTKPKIDVKAKPVAPSSVTLSLTRPEVPKVSKGPSLSVSTPKPTTTAANIEKVGKSLLKQMRADKTAEKAAKAVATAKAWKAAGGLASGVAAAYDAKTGYERAKAAGASERRALGSGAARAVGGLLGGAVGSTVGSVAGLPGAIVGGTAGYTAGSELASRVYNKITGPVGKKLTTQGVLTNIRTAVPREIRAQIPTNIRKGFTKFVTDAGRAYGNWSRSQEAKK